MKAAENNPAARKAQRWGMIAGPLAWYVNHGWGYASVQQFCLTQHRLLLLMSTVAGLVIASSGFFAALHAYHRRAEKTDLTADAPPDLDHFESVIGMAFSLSFSLAIIANLAPQLILNGCE